MDKLTNRRFAQLATYMAREVAAWAGDSLDDYPDDDGVRRIDKPMPHEALIRFCDGILARLASMQQQAGIIGDYPSSGSGIAPMGERKVIQQMTAAEYDSLPWMHVYAQYGEHEEARIVGTREALVALRDAIDAALVHPNGEAETSSVFARDGEGYAVEIRRVPRRAVLDSPLPYTAPWHRGDDAR